MGESRWDRRFELSTSPSHLHASVTSCSSEMDEDHPHLVRARPVPRVKVEEVTDDDAPHIRYSNGVRVRPTVPINERNHTEIPHLMSSETYSSGDETDSDDEPFGHGTKGAGLTQRSWSVHAMPAAIKRGRSLKKGNVPKHEGEERLNAIERNSGRPNDFNRRIPKVCIVGRSIHGHPERVSVDTRSLADFVSTTMVDQPKIPTEPLQKPLTVQLAVSRFRGKIQSSATVRFKCHGLKRFVAST